MNKIMESKKLARGQIWNWVDPIYGYKKENVKVDFMESTMRYSRQVLIYQDPETSDGHSILVIPLSSRKYFMNEIKLIYHYYESLSFSYDVDIR